MERKNEMKNTIKEEEDEDEDEDEGAKKVPLITFTVAAVGEFIRTRPFSLF